MYAKIFQQIYDSSVCEDWQVMITFQQLLILSNQDGVVDMTPEAISRRTNIPLEIISHGIERLEQPDNRSRCRDMDGRRIARLDEHRDWGWFIVNYRHYRQLARAEEKREADRSRIAEKRCTNNDVADSRIASQCVASSRPSEAEAYTEAEAAKGSPPATKQQEAPKRSGGLGRKQKNSTSPNGSVVWDFYSSAYQQRYGVLPTRNQKVNSQLAALVKRIGVDEAPNIAAFYLSHNRKLYVNSHHCTDLLLRDAEALRTEWLTGHKVTEWGARETDRLQTASDAVARVAKKLGAL